MSSATVRPAHGGYSGKVRRAARVVPLAPGLEMRDGVMYCTRCGSRARQAPNPTGGDSWFYVCEHGHEAWVGK